MTLLALNQIRHDCHTLFGPAFRLRTLEPMRALQRVDRGMSWFLGQPAPHEVVLDDTSGIAVGLVVAWVMTCDYPCSVTFVDPQGRKVFTAGLLENGHAFVSALAEP